MEKVDDLGYQLKHLHKQNQDTGKIDRERFLIQLATDDSGVSMTTMTSGFNKHVLEEQYIFIETYKADASRAVIHSVQTKTMEISVKMGF